MFRILLVSFIFSILMQAQASSYDDVGLPIINVFTQEQYHAHNQNWDIEQGKNQLIYVANGNGLLEFDGENWTLYPTPNRSRIRDIEVVDDKIYAGTTNDIGYFQANTQGVLSYHSLVHLIDEKKRRFGDVLSVVSFNKLIIFKTVDYYFIWDGLRLKTHEDKTQSRHKMIGYADQVYIKNASDEVVYLLSPQDENLLSASAWKLPATSQIKQILTDVNHKPIFITARSGIFTSVNDTLQKHDNDELDGVFVYDAIKTEDGFIYLATINKGLFVLSPQLEVVKNYRDFHGFHMNAMTSIFVDKQGNIWTAGNTAITVMRPPDELSRYSKSDNIYSHKMKYIHNKLTYLGRGILQLEKNSENNLFPPQFEKVTGSDFDVWDSVEINSSSIFATANGVEIGAIKQGEFIHQLISEQKIFNYAITATKDAQHVFVASDKGLYHLWKKNDNWQSQVVSELESEVNSLAIENDKTLWVGTSSPLLYRLEIQNIIDGKTEIQLFTQKNGIGNNKVVPFNTKSLGMVFVTNDGVMRYKGDKNKPLSFIENMPKIFHSKNEDAHLLYDDLDGRLWYRIGEHSGYAYRDKGAWSVHEELFNYFPPRSIDSFATTEHNIMWFLLSSDEIYRINVNKANKIPSIAPLYIRKVINSKKAQIIQSGVVRTLGNAIGNDNNSIRVNYALADYTILGKNRYRVRLLGSQNEDWSTWSTETYKDFTELRGADYTFEVQAQDGFGRLSPASSLTFKVLPPFYLSKAAFFLYGLTALILLVLTAWLVQKWRTKKLKEHNVHLAELVKQKTIEIEGHVSQLEQQQELKTRFFTNISHELRTPLSLIILPLQKLINRNHDYDKSTKQLLSLSLKHADGMKQLVNQVLDISRFEQKAMPIVPQQYDLQEFVNSRINKFKDLATENKQTILVNPFDESIKLYFDDQLMDKIISNLLSNAIKYSGEGSRITISFFKQSNCAGFIVKDNGIGIAKEYCEEVFDRYFRTNEEVAKDSSGIGLAFVKEMMDLHHGKIKLISDSHKGCEFQCQLLLGKQHFTSLKLQSVLNPIVLSDDVDRKLPEDTPVVLLVEDNTDLRHFINQALAVNFKVIQAINGKDALETLSHEIPDLIISDIMMPVMDGIEFLQKIKQFDELNTIPFILLSSKSSQSDTQLGLQYGADDYLTKPFDMEELLLRARNIIAKRRLIHKQLQKQLEEIKEKSAKKANEFEQKIRDIVLENLSDSHFNVTSLANRVGMERTTLFRKIKKELDTTPSKFIQTVRLEIAKELLTKHSISVSEVAYATGFESLSYFSKTFKNLYGQLPSSI